MENTVNPKTQASEAIRQAESILVTAGPRPSVDQVAAVLALTQILRALGKRVNPVISDQLPGKLGFLPLKDITKDLAGLRDFIISLDLSKAEVDKLRYAIEDGKLNLYVTPFSGSFARDEVSFNYGDYNYDLAIVLGVPARDKIDQAIAGKLEFFQKVPIINLDFHKSNENYGAINLIDSQAASLCEILAGLAESLEVKLDAALATALLTGLYASTDRFTAPHTSPKSLTLSAQLIAAGARHQQIVKSLFSEEKPKNPPVDTKAQQEKNQKELAKLAELKNPQPVKAEPTVQAIEEAAKTVEAKEEPKVKSDPIPEDELAPEERVEFELPEHIKSGLSAFLEK